jgi:hypothetical protein
MYYTPTYLDLKSPGNRKHFIWPHILQSVSTYTFIIDRTVICSTYSGSQYNPWGTICLGRIYFHTDKAQREAIPEVSQASPHTIPRTRLITEQHHQPTVLQHLHRGTYRLTRGTPVVTESTVRSVRDRAPVYCSVLCPTPQCPPYVSSSSLGTTTGCTGKYYSPLLLYCLKNVFQKHCGVGSLVVKVLDFKPKGGGFKSWPWQAGVVSLGKALCTNFLTPPKCKTGTVKDLVSMLVF